MAVSGGLDGGDLVAVEGRPTPALPHSRLLHSYLKILSVLCGTLVPHSYRGVIEKGDRAAILVDPLLYEVCVIGKKQDH